MNYSRAFSYVFEDKNWLSKILIAGLIFLIPIVGQIYLMGWMIEIVRRVKAGRTDILPTTHFAYFLTLGLKMIVVTLIYSIPVIIISGILQLIASTGNADDSVFTVFFMGVGCIGGLLSIVLQIAVVLLNTYGMIKLAETDQIKACLDFNDAFQCIKANIGTFIIVELLNIVAALIQSAGIIICIGFIFTVPYGIAISGHLTGQLWDNLKPYKKQDRPFRGSTADHSADIIEEAPFTMVQDIEKTAEEEAEEVKDTASETAEAVESILSSVEEPKQVSDQVEQIIPEQEEPESEGSEPEEKADDSPEKPDDDLPSFE